MFLDILELGIKTKQKKKNYLGKTVLKTWSQKFTKWTCFVPMIRQRLETCVNCVTKCVTAQFYPLEVQIFKIIFSKYIHGQLRPFFHKSETILSKQFFYTIFFVSIPSSRISRSMCKWRHKLQKIKNSVGPPFT